METPEYYPMPENVLTLDELTELFNSPGDKFTDEEMTQLNKYGIYTVNKHADRFIELLGEDNVETLVKLAAKSVGPAIMLLDPQVLYNILALGFGAAEERREE